MCKTIKQRMKFKASPEAGYDILADSTKHSAVVDLVPGRRIVQAWRHRRFPEGIFSMAAVTLTPTPDGGTELVRTHRGVPKDLIPETERAWREQYGSRIKAYLVLD